MHPVIWLALAALAAAVQGCVPVAAVGVGVGAGMMMGADRRTPASYLEDTKIETHAANQIFVKYKDTVHVNVTSFNGQVLITGEVNNEEEKSAVEQIALGVPKVKSVSNELAVSPLSGLAARSNDTLITSNVKLRFINNKIFLPDHIKVVTENGAVFLMGIVYRKEAEAATGIARNSQGVQRVVTVFEYLD